MKFAIFISIFLFVCIVLVSFELEIAILTEIFQF